LAETPRPFLSVIVPARNAAATLGDCLAALRDQSADSSGYEVIVVDDGSTDDTAAVASRSGARLIQQSHGGPASARNAGSRAAVGDILLFTDADCVPTRDWVREMAAPLVADPLVAAAKGIYRTRQRELIARFTQLELEAKYAHLRVAAAIDFIDTYAAAIRADAFWSVGGFDEEFPAASNEDTELSFALAARGYRLVFAEAAVVYHRHTASLGAYLIRKFRHGYWRTRVYRDYPKKMAGDSYTPRSTQVQLLAVALLPVAALGTALGGSALPLVASLLAFLIACATFVARALPADPPVAVATPGLLFLRAVALLSGLADGAITLVAQTALGIVRRCGSDAAGASGVAEPRRPDGGR
jgi:glycosyltransferase involved in cell wall biosynthesis